MLWTLRRWLIRLVVGRVQVMANLSVMDGVVQLNNGRAYIWSSKFTNSKEGKAVFKGTLSSFLLIEDSKVTGPTKVERSNSTE